MALIICPHCGKSVSDSTDKCIHCGRKLSESKETETKLKEFTNLPNDEKKKLREEFQKAYPTQKDWAAREEKLKKLRRISMICVIVSAVLTVIALLTAESLGSVAIMAIVVCVILFVASDAIDIACPFLIRRNKKKSLVALKIFQRWLKDKKGIDYVVSFNAADAKWKRYFDGINVAAEGYRE